MAIDKDKIITLLGSGVKPGQVAAAVGCDISYISQLLADEQVAQRVSELRTEEVLRYKNTDNKYDDIEAKLQQKLEDIIPFVTKPDQIIRALAFVNSAKRRAQTGIQGEIDSGDVVRLTLPAVTINNYKVTINGNMVEVGGRSLAPMSSAILLKTLEQQSGASNANQKEVPKLLGKSDGSRFPSEHVVHEGKI